MLEQLEQLLKGGHFSEVRRACEALLERNPNGAVVRHVLGLLKVWSGDIRAGNEMLSASITSRLAAVEGTFDLPSLIEVAREMRHSERHAEAVDLLTRCLLLSPTNHLALLEMGICLQGQLHHLEAEGFFRAALVGSPREPKAAYGLGMALLCTGRPAEAAPFLFKAVELEPHCGNRWRQLAMALIQNSQHAAAVQALKSCVDLSPNDPSSLSQQIFVLHYCPTRLQEPLLEAYQRYASKFCHPMPRDPLTVGRTGKRRLAYVSGDLKAHPVSFFLEPLLANHDKSQFELFAYNNTLNPDQTTDRLRSHFDHWSETTNLSDEQLFELIQQDNIDILIDLSGHTPKNRLKIFARRAAPLQITMIGAMMTTGIPTIDFRVTDSFLDPEPSGSTRPYGTETPLRMNAGAVVFSPPPVADEVAPSPVTFGAPFTFGSLNDPAKITDEALAAWAEILHQAPRSRIILTRRPGNLMKEILMGHGIAEDRIIERNYVPLPQFLQMMGEVDLALDPFPYNGLTVTLQSCWMGVPPITLLGATPPARAAGMILTRMGMKDFVTTSLAEYVQKAVQHARDPHRLISLRGSLRERTRTAWCDAQNYTREFEEHLLRALALNQPEN